jgi:GH24 family phage-related lysozyme (muramidase)
MRYLNTYNKYSEDLLVERIIDFIDNSINESQDSESILQRVINKLKNLSDSAKKKVLKYTIISLLAIDSITNVIRIIQNSNLEKEDKKVAIEICEEKEKEKEIPGFKPGYEFEVSEAGISLIKGVEELKLVPYKLGDGKITVGWGHAENPKKSKLRVGKKISKERAESFFKKDLQTAVDGVKRIFKEWESKGLDVKINQKMFDALVSLAFNTGISSLRQSEVIQHLKNKDYDSAKDSIKSFNLGDKFSKGLKIRREKESEMFSASL